MSYNNDCKELLQLENKDILQWVTQKFIGSEVPSS